MSKTQKYHNHIDPYHMSLYIVLAVLLGLFLFYPYQNDLHATFIVLASVLYFFWTVVYHWRKKDLTLPLLAEYFFFIIFALVMVYTVLLRS